MRTTVATFLILAGFFSQAINAQNDQPGDSANNTTADASMEEITVIGQRTLTSIRMQIDRASDRIFDLYNELNTDDLYDIHCRRVAATGTHLRRKVCTPVYFELAEADATQANLTGGAGTGLFIGKIAIHNPIMGEKWKAVINNNPEIVDAIVEHFELTEELKETRKVYFNQDE